VKLLHEISPPLHHDLLADIDDVVIDIKKSHVGEPPLADFDDHLKSGIRSLFGYIEATTWCLTTAVLQHFGSDPSALVNSDRAVLEERDYDASTDTISSQARRYSLFRRFEVGSRTFLQACGAQPAPPWDAESIGHFQTLTKARNALTHPARIEDLIVTPAFVPFRHMAAWFPLQAMHILASSAQVLGLPRPPMPAPVAFPPLAPMPQPKHVFDDDFYKRVFSEPALAIRYIAFFSQKIDDELRRAFDLCSTALSPPYTADKIGRSVRRMVRAVTTNVEGTIGFTSFFMRAVRFSGAKITLPQPAKGESVPDRMIRVLTAFSRAFGNDVTPDRSSAWDSLVRTFEIRDRLTHPRVLRDIDLTIGELEPPMKALDWLWEPAHEAVLLSPDKIAMVVGAR
jgi:hypothetical protein